MSLSLLYRDPQPPNKSPTLVVDPMMGRMTGANMQLVTINVHLEADDPEPEQHLDEVSPESLSFDLNV